MSRPLFSRTILLAAGLACLALAATTHGETPLPRFDGHIHYSRDAWDTLSPAAAIEVLRAAGVRRAIVSSTPDDGTLRLYEADSRLVVPFLRPYRSARETTGWMWDPEIRDYVEDRLANPVYRGIGEIHIMADEANAPVMRRMAELAAERDLFVHAHTDAKGIRALLSHYPDVRMIWAHAGMFEPPDEVRAILDAYSRVWVELSQRYDIAPGGKLSPGWKRLFLRHPDRFIVGTDTYVATRWGEVVAESAWTRRWLAELPVDVAERIAYRTGDALFPN